jgi:tryptophan synthase alpha chain
LSRIGPALAAAREQGRTALAPFLTVGYPEPSAFPGLVTALVEGGADMLELGVPFSDPLADGATIQRANFIALQHGVTTSVCLEAVRALREQGLEVPVLLMGYYNPILAYGLEGFAAEAAAAGVDGLIVVDLPPEEAGPLQEA